MTVRREHRDLQDREEKQLGSMPMGYKKEEEGLHEENENITDSCIMWWKCPVEYEAITSHGNSKQQRVKLTNDAVWSLLEQPSYRSAKGKTFPTLPHWIFSEIL